MALPLDGVRVLELGNFVAGPYAATILADFGADVIRVEVPGRIDDSRRTGGVEPEDAERTPFFATGLGRGKRSLTLDVRQPAGHAVFLRLAEVSDVVVENLQPGRLEEWGLGPSDLEAVNPRLVLLRISGYGQTGPWARRPGFDRAAQAFGGLTFLTGHRDRPPVPAGLVVADYGAAVWGALGVLLALRERESSNRGQVVDIALYGSLLPLLNEVPTRHALHKEVRQRQGSSYPRSPMLQVLEAADGAWIQLAAVGQRDFERLCQAMAQPALTNNPAFLTEDDREHNRDALREIVAGWARGRDGSACLGILESAGIACSPVHDIAGLVSHPQVVARQDLLAMDDPAYGPIPAIAPPPRLSRTPARAPRPGPALGADTESILGELLGMPADEVVRLRSAGAV